MVKVEQQPTVEVEVKLTLTEAEARALHALTLYGMTAFLKVFYEHLGSSDLRTHEAGLRSLFEGIQGTIPVILRRADAAWNTFRKDQTQ